MTVECHSIKHIKIADNIWIFQDCINVGVIVKEGNALIIDCGDGAVLNSLGELGISSIEWVLFTHHHRDQASGVKKFINLGAKIGVPFKERALFENVDTFWENPQNQYHRYQLRPHLLTIRESITVDLYLSDKEIFRWRGIEIIAIETPGHTDGSLSYLIRQDGKTIVFSGDLIYSGGKVWDIFSLQKGNEYFRDYHGFLGDSERLICSLERLLSMGADILIPSHGKIIQDPLSGVKELEHNMETVFRNYLQAASARFYFKESFKDYSDLDGFTGYVPSIPLPEWIIQLPYTSRALIAEDKSLFLIDCGSDEVVRELINMKEQGLITGVDGVWITHYHDDHVDGIKFLKEYFSCPVYAHREIVDILEHPSRYSMPCLSHNAIDVDVIIDEAQIFNWKRIKMTGYYFPGQTLYHDALFVEYRGKKVLFTGDSFTNGGIDDYCTFNRNIIKENHGYDYTIELVRKLNPDILINQHVNNGFKLTDNVLNRIREGLFRRKSLLHDLLPWEDINYGLDPNWVCCYPYYQRAERGSVFSIEVRIQNYSEQLREAEIELRFPSLWEKQSIAQKTIIEPNNCGVCLFQGQVPIDLPSGRYLIGVNVCYNKIFLGEWAIAILEIESE